MPPRPYPIDSQQSEWVSAVDDAGSVPGHGIPALLEETDTTNTISVRTGKTADMREDAVFSTLYVGVLLAVPGLLAWITGQAFIFPSLGPSAFLLATVREGEVTAPRRVVGGHFIGVAAGLVAFHTIAPEIGVSVTTDAPMLATAQLRFVASGVVAVVLTAGGMLATETVHPPACATTLIVSLGLLSSFLDGALIMLAVVVLLVAHKLVMYGRPFGDAVSLDR